MDLLALGASRTTEHPKNVVDEIVPINKVTSAVMSSDCL